MADVTEPYITTLAASEVMWSDRLSLCGTAGIVHHVTLQPGTPYEETVRVWDCFGTGPYVLRLGHGVNHRAFLRHAHPIGSVVRIEAVSAELAAARRKAALGLCMHPEAVPVSTFSDPVEIVAWMCPHCDEALPADWGLT